MSIPIEKDPAGEPPWEHCCFCFKPTPFWNVKADVACCRACAATHEVEHLPTKELWCEQVKQVLAEQTLDRVLRSQPRTKTLRQEKLAQAAKIIREVAARLDTSGKVCPSCKRDHKTNWNESQAATELEAMARKLERMDGRIRGLEKEGRT